MASAPTPDGGVVTFLDGGDPAGFPVLGLHGTPGCRLSRWPDDDVYARAGVRYVTLDRPGYGQSSRQRGRSVASATTAVLAVAEHLGLDRFAVTGTSGGGPHALACAALLPDRVVRVESRSGPAPVGPGGLQRRDWVADLPDGEAMLQWVAESEIRVVRERQAQQDELVDTLGQDLGSLDPRVAERFREIVREQALQGVSGAVDDTFALTRPWGFNLSTVDVPVLLTHRTADAAAPPSHTRWLAARLRGAVTSYDEDAGDRSPEDDVAAAMGWLRG
ncbi:alpha/beta fold hydrolase [Nocardioides rubriscoriae]|uniref:alpha/beta fold hydrolase n=1 Tax=Nocardioides rubriscoriae TaxID=642762 RepID=UPI0014793F52|nr:alpha/beta hydrolase [Nocardioides rubriscoriae]